MGVSLGDLDSHAPVDAMGPRIGWWRRPAPLVMVVTLVAGYLARVWIRHSTPPLVWNDTADYLTLARTGLWSTDRWLGIRPVLMPTVVSVLGMNLDHFVVVQTAFAALAWALLAAAVTTALKRSWRKWLAAAAVLGLSLTWAVALWDQEVLTESLALSTLALVAAAGVWAADRLTPVRAAVLVAAVALWLAVRDSHVIPVALAGFALGGWALVRGRADRRAHRRTGQLDPLVRPSKHRRFGANEAIRRPPWVRLSAGSPGRRRRGEASRVAPVRPGVALLTAAYLLALAFLVAGAAQYANRDRVPIEHVYAVRILPYPDRVAWFADHGMPESAALSALAPVQQAGKAPFVVLNPPPQWTRWRSWIASHGRSTLVGYTLAHPTYVIDEPRRTPEMVFNNGTGLSTYRSAALREIPGLAAIFYPPMYLSFLMGAMAIPVASWRETLTSAPFLAGTVLAATSLPHALVVWHSDGMESARHLLVPGIQFRTGALLLLTGALLSHPRENSRPSGHRQVPRNGVSDANE